jgi:Salmonella virulence plasmid 65kDa B protein
MGRHYSWGRGRILFLKKLLAIVLTLSFSFSPLITFAQEVGSGTAPLDSGSSSVPGDTSTDTQTQTPPVSFSIPGVGTADSSGTDATPAETDSESHAPATQSDTTDNQAPASPTPPPPGPPPPASPPPPPSIDNSTVFTLQDARPKADGQSGALLQNLKLDIPPGRNGVQPDLSLEYNSQSAEDSIVGYGWTVTIPYIQRLNKLGSQKLYNVPYYTSSIDGDLATTSSATTTQSFGAKVDSGTFNSYSFTNNVWTMYDKHGTRYLFGASDNSQQNASASSTQIYTWYLQKIRDTNNNHVRYVYAKDSGQIYPQTIYYTSNGGTDGIFKISFSTSTRLDPYVSYKPLFKVTTNYRVSKITAAINGTIVREYDLSYTAGNNGVRSLLSSFQENAWDTNGNNEVTLPAETFSYVNDSSGGFIGRPTGGNIKSQADVVADINGDAKPDVTWTYNNSGTLTGYTEPGGGNAVSLPTPPDYWASTDNTCESPEAAERGFRLVDVNADGKADYIQGRDDSSGATTGAWINTYSTSTGYAWGGGHYSIF